MLNKQLRRQSQGGNVLFLILIAVALFAALSYVVTQSTRSGTGSTEREKNILSSAQMTQYPTALRTALIRMVLAGTGIENIKFNDPDNFGTSVNAEVFHPSGGGATYQDAPADLSSAGTSQLHWFYNASFFVPGIGLDSDTSGVGISGNDVIAFLPGVSAGVCKQTNDQLGLKLTDCVAGDLTNGVPTVAAADAEIRKSLDKDNDFPTSSSTPIRIETGASCEPYSRQASGCFHTTSPDQYVFYSVLLER